ncbi:MAG TPA: VOC family protein [Acidobacteriaceae bacterium]|jgi:PhnB protein|nr:VOC family protein [Acidobacteriaceae bacterium]
MKLSSYLHFDGDCEDAFKLYEKVLGGNIQGFFRFGQSPMAGMVGPDWGDKIMHVALNIGDQTLLGCDAPPQYFRQPQGSAVCIECADEAEAERLYPALSEGGQIGMPLQETFWAKRYAQFVDRFGTSWMINVSKPM